MTADHNTTSRALRTMNFYGDEVLTFDHDGTPMVAMRRIVENMGMAWQRQSAKLIEQKGKFSCNHMVTTGSDGKRYDMLCMPVAKLALWLASINPNKINDPVIRNKVEIYQAESAIALHDYWTKGSASMQSSTASVSEISAEVRKVIGGIIKSVVHNELSQLIASMLPGAVMAEIANRTSTLRHGKTAGQIWHAAGYPPIKIAAWFGNRLAKFGCQIEGGGRGELGLNRARLFDPDRAETWLREGGGDLLVRQKIAERKGQGVLHLVGKVK